MNYYLENCFEIYITQQRTTEKKIIIFLIINLLENYKH